MTAPGGKRASQYKSWHHSHSSRGAPTADLFHEDVDEEGQNRLAASVSYKPSGGLALLGDSGQLDLVGALRLVVSNT
jgi:hypothetical protein